VLVGDVEGSAAADNVTVAAEKEFPVSRIGDRGPAGTALRERARVVVGRIRRAERADVAESTDRATEVEVHRHADGVLELRLKGASRRNALGRSTIDRLESLVSIPPVGTRIVVLTAEGPDFSAGYDLREAAHGNAERLIANGLNFALLKKSRVPVIAALHGNVIGGGLELALSADVRIATPSTKFGLPAGRLGLVYSEEGIRLLVDSVGESRARSMLLAGNTLSCAEAQLSGIVSEVVEDDLLEHRALELAATIASWPEVATSGNRRVLNVVLGTDREDAKALRLASFEPGGALAQSIERFGTGHSDAVVGDKAPRLIPLEKVAIRLRSLGHRINAEADAARSVLASRGGGARRSRGQVPAPLVLASAQDPRTAGATTETSNS
jgi:enoyl-CoA hydratase/carnithine racemase